MDEELRQIADRPDVSRWLKNAILDSLNRDPVDAANDARVLHLLLDKRVEEILAAHARLVES